MRNPDKRTGSRRKKRDAAEGPQTESSSQGTRTDVPVRESSTTRRGVNTVRQRCWEWVKTPRRDEIEGALTDVLADVYTPKASSERHASWACGS
jgi:hypothetical protein